MHETIQKAYSYLESFDFVLPYSHALSFCYLNPMYFMDGLRPNFKLRFKPFQEIKSHTYFCIEDMVKYTNSTRESINVEYLLGISFIIIIGYENDKLSDLFWTNSKLIEEVGDYSTQFYNYDELYEMGNTSKTPRTFLYELLGSKKFREKYDININAYNNDVLIISHPFVI